MNESTRPKSGWYPRQRSERAELMDNPTSDRHQLERTLSQLSLVNRVLSRMRLLVRRYVISDMHARGITRATVLDVGAGGCDIALWLAGAGEQHGLKLKISCLDYDERVVAYAKRRVKYSATIGVVHGSAFEIDGQWDYIICNHFLHHLAESDILRFLDLSHAMCRRRLLVNDLLRSNWSLIGFRLFSRLLLQDSFARHDGVLSIQRGFRPHELQHLVEQSRWGSRAQVGQITPGRVFIVGSRAVS